MKYGCLYADPAWSFDTYSRKGRRKTADRHYPCLSVEEIAALPVGELAGPNCALFLWTTGPFLRAAFRVAEAWGFRYSTTGFTWAKRNPSGHGWASGTGYWTRANPEYCLLFTSGSPRRQARDVPELVVAPRGRHSEKPEEVARRIEALAPGPYCELFARRTRAGWDALGGELDGLQLAESIRRLAAAEGRAVR